MAAYIYSRNGGSAAGSCRRRRRRVGLPSNWKHDFFPSPLLRSPTPPPFPPPDPRPIDTRVRVVVFTRIYFRNGAESAAILTR